MRTNIVISDTLMAQALSLSALRTKREVVEQALAEFVENRQRHKLAELKGKIQFADGYDHKMMRRTGQK